eukprot:COSAG06_NODE_2456_length_6848_cov_66.970959_4_plen_76_part_00
MEGAHGTAASASAAVDATDLAGGRATDLAGGGRDPSLSSVDSAAAMAIAGERKRYCLSVFYIEMHNFAKTGSGQT